MVVTPSKIGTIMWGPKSGRTKPLPKAWRMIRANVLRRDKYQCVQVREDTGLPCGARATDVDHIDDPDDHTHKNLRSLCSYHHDQKTASQGGKAAGRKYGRSHVSEAHPGLTPILYCKHCGREIENGLHEDGPNLGKQRCHPDDSNLPHGYDAEPEDTPCSKQCLGYRKK